MKTFISDLTGTDPNSKTGRMFGIIGIIGWCILVSFLGFAIFTLIDVTRDESNATYDLWGPNRVAERYTECLDNKLGVAPGFVSTGKRDPDDIELKVRTGALSYEELDARLSELGCETLPKEAYEYRTEYGNEIRMRLPADVWDK